jgi:hypothetical protein
MVTTYTEAEFDDLSWHDCHLWAVRFDVGDPDENDWTNDLVLDLDFIVEWQCPNPTRFGFRVAPAQLVFHGVTDPRISINWGTSGFQNVLHPVSIDCIYREQVQDQKVYLDRPYFSWRIAFNWPEGEIVFGAVGFTQSLLAEPVILETQYLPRSVRNRLTSGSRRA